MKKLLCLILSLNIANSFACTEVQIVAKDGSVVIGRSFDFEIPSVPRIMLVPRGHERSTTAPDGTIGKKWKNKYSYLKVALFNDEDMVPAIINEKGLSMELLWLRDDTTWPVPKTAEEKKNAMEVLDYFDYINGNCASVAEVKQQLAKLTIWAKKLKIFGDAQAPAHFAFHDKTGANIVVEFINGQMKIYDNRHVGVLANSPNYEWQVTNLRNYISTRNIDSIDKQMAADIGEPNLKPLVGSSYVGKPGGFDSASRFVSAFLLKELSEKPANSDGALALADQIINNVSKPKGSILIPMKDGKFEEEYTQWRTLLDLTNMNLYIHETNKVNYVKIDLNKLFTKNDTPKIAKVSDLMVAPNDVTDMMK
jgi:choloylglycine hydrolase